MSERAEPPIDGDRVSKAIDAAFEATYPDQLRRGTVMYHKLRNALIASLGAAEPPSAPAPCPTNHKTVGGDKWDMPRHYTVKGEIIMWRPKFCPDCGASLGVPESEKA